MRRLPGLVRAERARAYDGAVRTHRTGRLVGGLVALTLAAACGQSSSGDAPLGVLLISVDSLRADHLSCYGYESPTAPGVATSPNIDARLAAEGTLFETLSSTTSWTVPAHMAMLSGQPDRIHGVLAPASRLPAGRRLLAQDFQDAGWSTAGFFSGPNLHPWFGFGRGFDLYADCTSMGVDPARFGPATPAERKKLRAMEDASHRGHTGELVSERFGEWFDELDADEPFFAFVHLWDAHYDYEPPAEFDLFDPGYQGTRGGGDIPELVHADLDPRDAAHIVALYDGEIRYVDHTVATLLDRLAASGRLDNTLIVFTSDHGEEFGEHGRYGHNKTLFDEVIAVPLILRWPGRVAANQRIDAQASLVDLAPTILELAELPASTGHFGRSLAGGLVTGGQLEGQPAPLELAIGRADPTKKRAPMEGLRTNAFKVVRERPGEKPVVFDLTTDPSEAHPLNVPHDDERLALARALWKAISTRGAALPRETGTLPGALEEELTNIGYLGGDE